MRRWLAYAGLWALLVAGVVLMPGVFGDGYVFAGAAVVGPTRGKRSKRLDDSSS